MKSIYGSLFKRLVTFFDVLVLYTVDFIKIVCMQSFQFRLFLATYVLLRMTNYFPLPPTLFQLQLTVKLWNYDWFVCLFDRLFVSSLISGLFKKCFFNLINIIKCFFCGRLKVIVKVHNYCRCNMIELFIVFKIAHIDIFFSMLNLIYCYFYVLIYLVMM